MIAKWWSLTIRKLWRPNSQTISTPIPTDWSESPPTVKRYRATISSKMGKHSVSKSGGRKSCRKTSWSSWSAMRLRRGTSQRPSASEGKIGESATSIFSDGRTGMINISCSDFISCFRLNALPMPKRGMASPSKIGTISTMRTVLFPAQRMRSCRCPSLRNGWLLLLQVPPAGSKVHVDLGLSRRWNESGQTWGLPAERSVAVRPELLLRECWRCEWHFGKRPRSEESF